MAKIIDIKTGKSELLVDGEEIRSACEKLGVPFSCSRGVCGACMIQVIDGKENLSELTEQEKHLLRSKEHRLACQCKIKKGEVKIKF